MRISDIILKACYTFAGITLSLGISLSFEVPYARAGDQYLMDDGIRIQRHDRRRTRFLFSSPEKTDPLDYWGMLYESSIYKEPGPEEALLVSYEKLPLCETSHTKLIEVHHHSEDLGSEDVLFYSPQDRTQAQRAKKYPHHKVAYIPALIRNPKTGKIDPDQLFARFIRISCLPTRFRFIYVGSKRYAEFRTGADAWKE